MIEVAAIRRPVDRGTLRMGAPRLDPTVLSSTLVRDAETGAPALATVPFAGDLAAYRRAVRSYPMDTTVRTGGIRNVSNVFGYGPRNPVFQRSCCSACSQAARVPKVHQAICRAAGDLAEMMSAVVPEAAEADLALVKSKVRPDWLLHPHAPWTSGVVNLTSPLPYHFDGNNFDAWSAMVVLRRGVRGGYLHLPGWRLADGSDVVVACRDGDVVFFNGQEAMHGVTPMRKVSPDAYRLSVVYYPVAKMQHCLSFAEELERGRRARSVAEDDQLARQRETGALA